jgi:prophage regulatory protein
MSKQSIEFWSKKIAAEKVGFHPHHLDRMAREGRFPKPVTLSSNRVAFVRSEVEAWMRARIAERNTGKSQPRRNPQERSTTTEAA